MNIQSVRKIAEREEIDYQFLISILSNYAHPRDKISAWLKTGDLIRVKKGLYVFGKEVALAPYSLEVLANLIYGPSAISLQYALMFYGLIPERVITITSITNKRNKQFLTPIGEFNYQFLNSNKYSIGVELRNYANNRYFLIASPEKALCDYIYLIDKKYPLNNLEDVEAYLFEDLRIDKNILSSFRINLLNKISQIYANERLTLMIKFIKKWKQNAFSHSNYA